MKVQTLISKLEKLKDKHGNVEVVIDYETNGDDDDVWYPCDKVEQVTWYCDHKETSEKFINITWER